MPYVYVWVQLPSYTIFRKALCYKPIDLCLLKVAKLLFTKIRICMFLQISTDYLDYLE